MVIEVPPPLAFVSQNRDSLHLYARGFETGIEVRNFGNSVGVTIPNGVLASHGNYWRPLQPQG